MKFPANPPFPRSKSFWGPKLPWEENDLYQLEPMLHETKESLAGAGIEKGIDTCTADTGYWRDDLPVGSIEAEGPKLLIAVQKDWKQREQCLDEEHSQGRIPADASSRERMGRRLKTKWGKAKYKLRSQTVEPVFGQIKSAMGIYGFMRRGMDAVRSEWKLICSCHNLMKLFRASEWSQPRKPVGVELLNAPLRPFPTGIFAWPLGVGPVSVKNLPEIGQIAFHSHQEFCNGL